MLTQWNCVLGGIVDTIWKKKFEDFSSITEMAPIVFLRYISKNFNRHSHLVVKFFHKKQK